MTYIERKTGNKVIYGCGSIPVPVGYTLFPGIYRKIAWSIGPFSKEVK